MMRHKRNYPRQQGTSLVEFAFVAPVFFLLLFGIIEFGVILFDKATITNASREGARAGILFRKHDTGDRSIGGANLVTEKTEIETVVDNYVSTYLMSLGGSSSITTTVTRTDRDGSGVFDVGDDLTVSVSYPYNFLILPGFAAGLSDFTLGATTVMRAE
jgi:Flp pilus assembly protein TadG